jgi:hypothetical protein
MKRFFRFIMAVVILAVIFPSHAAGEGSPGAAIVPSRGRTLKLYMTDGSTASGEAQVWEGDRIILKTDAGEQTLAPKNLTRAVYLVGDESAAPGERKVFTPSDPSVGKVDENEQRRWKQRLEARQGGCIVLYATGIATLIGGLAVTFNGIDQRDNAKFKQKGNVLTNEDDVNEGNQKVVTGSLIELGGALLVVGGIMMGHSVGDLKDEGQRKGFSLSLGTRNDPRGITLVYQRRF